MSEINKYLDDILVVYKHASCAACNQVSDALKEFGYKHTKKLREKVKPSDFKKPRQVIVVAGDGTLLRTCQSITNDSPVLGVNSDPIFTEGWLTRANVSNFPKKFQRILNKKSKVLHLPRLEVRINGKKLPGLALNEVSISREKTYLTFMHELNGSVERSTGILVSTPIGSTAWCKSAGGKKLKLSCRKMEYVIREPYKGTIYKVKKRYGLVNSFRMKSIMDGLIVFDSVNKEYPFKREDEITVDFSDKKINLLEP